MKIAVTAEKDSLGAKVDPRFGRCQYFVIVDTDTAEFEAVRNPNIELMGGAGIQSAQLMASRQVRALITGNVGPNAFETLSASGIEVITGVSGTVEDAVENYKKGKLNAVSAPSVMSKFGIPNRNK